MVYKYKVIESNGLQYLFSTKNKAQNYIDLQSKLYPFRKYELIRLKQNKKTSP